MPRDSSGTYTLPGAYNPVVTGTTIQAAWANTTLADVAQGVTDSLDRSGRGAMLVALKGFDGSIALPGYTFSNESTTGISRPSSGNMVLSILGAEVARLTSAGLSILGALTTTGNTALGDAVADTFSVSGSVIKNATGNWVIPAPNSGGALTVGGAAASGFVPSIGAVGGAITGFSARDTTSSVEGLFITYGGVGVAYGSFTNHVVDIRTNNTARLSISNTGNVTIAAPSSGVALTLAQFTGSRLIRGTGTAPSILLTDDIAAGPSLSIGASAAASFVDFTWTTTATPGAIRVGGVDALGFSTARNVTIAAPSSGVALTVSGQILATRLQSTFDGTASTNVIAPGDILARRSATSGVYWFGDNGANYLFYDGTNYNIGPGALGTAALAPATNNAQPLGTAAVRWSTVNSVLGNFSGLLTTSVGANVGNVAQASATTLDWYEEGTFTATAVGGTTAGVATYLTQIGRFVRLGRLVYVFISISWSTHTGTGFTRIGGLPYAAAGQAGKWFRAVPDLTGIAFDAWQGFIGIGNGYMELYGNNQNSGTNAQRSIAANDVWNITGFYEV